jgi:hypothetical protein
MSEDEKRAIRAAALLEFEEAKDDLALLRAKAEQWRKRVEKVQHLLTRMRRDDAGMERAAVETRMELAAHLPATVEAMNIEAVFALDGELQTAVQRLKKAEAAKKALGFNVGN